MVQYPLLQFEDLVKPEEWVKSSKRNACTVCGTSFTLLRRRNNCRKCGDIMCGDCAVKRQAQMPMVGVVSLRVCRLCHDATSHVAPALSSQRSHRALQSRDSSSSPSTVMSANSAKSAKSNKSVEGGARPRQNSNPYLDSSATSCSSFEDLPVNDGLWDVASVRASWIPVHELEPVRPIAVKPCHGLSLVRHGRKRMLVSKQLAHGTVTKRTAKAFLRSINTTAQLEHQGIVRLVGVSWTPETDVQALYEFMPNGDLRSYLDARGAGAQPHIHNARKISIALDIAEALVYLHSQEPPIVHGALQSRKVLLDAAYRGKLVGLGQTHGHHAINDDSRSRLWSAPEVLTGAAPTTTACDIYSFGVIMTELDADRMPFSGCVDIDGQPLADSTVELRLSYGALPPILQRTCPPEVRQLVNDCLSFDAKERPTALELLVRLRTFIRTYGIETAPDAPSTALCDLDLDTSNMWRDPSVAFDV